MVLTQYPLVWLAIIIPILVYILLRILLVIKFNKITVNILLLIAFLLIPTLSILNQTYDYNLQQVSYGYGEITLNGIILLLFGFYCFIVCGSNFILSRNLWIGKNNDYKKEVIKSYSFTLIFAIFISLLSLLKKGDSLQEFIKKLFGSIIISPITSGIFLFAIGIFLLELYFISLKYKVKEDKSQSYDTYLKNYNSYLHTMLAVAVILIIINFIFAGLSIDYLLKGGIGPL